MVIKIARKTSSTLYEKDFKIIEEENARLEKINGSLFNLSSFVRYCLRSDKIMSEYRKTESYRNEK